MSEFEHELMDLLERNGRFDKAKTEVLRLQIGKDFGRKKKRLLIWTWIWHAVGGVMIISGFSMLAAASSTKGMIEGGVLVLLGSNCLVVIKLWYWIVHTRLNVMREVKRLELQVSELATRTGAGG